MELLNATTWVEQIKDNPKDEIKLIVGDDKQPDFKPQIKTERWGNEVNCSIRLVEDKDELKETPVISDDNGKIKYVKSKREVHIYNLGVSAEHPENATEFEVILKEKPKSNVVEFTLETKGLDFFYQPPLTQKEIDEGASRPENVVGSYAVYHKTKGGMNEASGMEYKVGKFGHIYRPKIIDANGNETWGELNVDVDKGLLTVTIDDRWLDEAVYPVIVDPTFGYTTMGLTGVAVNNAINSANNTMPEDGSVTKLTIACYSDTETYKSFKGIVGLNSTHNIVSGGIGNAFSMVTAGYDNRAWMDSTFDSPLSLTGTVVYDLGAIGNGIDSSNDTRVLWDATGAGATNYRYVETNLSNSYASPANPTYDSTVDYTRGGIYATYTADAGSASSSPSSSPSATPSSSPSTSPSATPSSSPSGSPSQGTPSNTPSGSPSSSPSQGTPSNTPSATPSSSPSGSPSNTPSSSPSGSPSQGTPSNTPSSSPSASPSEGTPSSSPSAPAETVLQVDHWQIIPQGSASASPSSSPSGSPSTSPSATPSASPSEATPSNTPSNTPSASPSEGTPSQTPSNTPSGSPSQGTPSNTPSGSASASPSEATPSNTPSSSPSATPSATPSGSPSSSPSEGTPSNTPSGSPSGSPSEATPSNTPSNSASASPSEGTPSNTPSGSPSESTPSGSPSEGTLSSSPSEGTASGSPSEGTGSASPSEATPSHSPSGSASASPSEGTPSGSPSASPSAGVEEKHFLSILGAGK